MRTARVRPLCIDPRVHGVLPSAAERWDSASCAIDSLENHVQRCDELELQTVTRGTRVTYEAVVEKHGKKTEVAVKAAGKSIQR